MYVKLSRKAVFIRIHIKASNVFAKRLFAATGDITMQEMSL